MEYEGSTCPKCKGKGIVRGEDGSVSTCFDCLMNGRLDQHNKNVKDSGIKV
jgi:hypothetical protein